MSLSGTVDPQEGPSQPESTHNAASSKAPFKSWRKKYRKMRVSFEDVMRENSALFRDEHLLLAKARRLQERNDQLLEMIIDLNDSPQIPTRLRFDLDRSTPSPSDVPSLEADADAAKTGHAQGGSSQTDATSRSRPGMKSLKSLLESVVHTNDAPADLLPSDLKGDLPGYFTPDHEEEYLQNIDLAIANGFSASAAPLLRAAANSVIPTDKEQSLKNPNSVVNWLRRNQPNVFLQDKDIDHASEKAGGKAGAASQRGKRASLTAAQQQQQARGPDSDAFEDENGYADGGAGSGRGRKNKYEDDGAYRPPRPGGRGGKRKREDGGGNGDKSAEKPAKRKYVRHSAPGPAAAASSGGS